MYYTQIQFGFVCFFFLQLKKNITVSVELVNKYSSDSVKPKTSENKFKKIAPF